MARFEHNRGVRALQTSVHDLEEVFALRLLLEVPATRRACQQLDAAGRKELRLLHRAMERAAESDDEFRLREHVAPSTGRSRRRRATRGSPPTSTGCATRCCAGASRPRAPPARSTPSSRSTGACSNASNTVTPRAPRRRCVRTCSTPRLMAQESVAPDVEVDPAWTHSRMRTD